jgi:Mrp family chromosome partitioning ATPase
MVELSILSSETGLGAGLRPETEKSHKCYRSVSHPVIQFRYGCRKTGVPAAVSFLFQLVRRLLKQILPGLSRQVMEHNIAGCKKREPNMAKHTVKPGQIADRMPGPDPDEQARQSLERITHKFIIMSGKGGVGKTSVSVNLALALARKGYQVGLLDVDLHGPDIPHMLGISGMLTADDSRKMVPIPYSDHLKIISMESLMPNRDEAIIWRGPVKHAAIRQFIGDVNWGNLDFLLIDSPPGTGDEPLTVAQLIPEAKAVIVTTPQEVALADIRKSISFCKNVRMEIFGIIENMSGFTCPHCGKVVDLFGTGGGEKTAKNYGIPFLGRIAFDPEMVQCSDSGMAFQQKFTQSPITLAFEEIADKMAG